MSIARACRWSWAELAAAALLVACPGCRTLLAEAVDADLSAGVVSADFGSMRNAAVSGNVWLGSTPAPSDLDLARRRDVRCVVDLCTPDERPAYDVAARCAELGIQYVNAGVEERKSISEDVVDRVLAVLTREETEHLLLVCKDGSRAAMFMAIHRVIVEGESLHDAVIEARRAGMRPGFQERFVRAQVERLGAQERLDG